MSITKVHIENFQSHADSSFELSPRVTIFTGESDQGKTSILRALKKFFRNIPTGSFFVSYWAKTSKITAEIDGVTVVREVGDKVINRFQVGKDEYNNFGIAIPEEVKARLKVADIQDFGGDKIDFNIQSQHDGLFLSGGSGVETLRGKIFSALTGSDLINKALATLNSLIRSRKAERERVQEAVSKLRAQVTSFDYLRGVIDQLQAISALEKKYTETKLLLENLKRLEVEYEELIDNSSIVDQQVLILNSFDSTSLLSLCENYLTMTSLHNDLQTTWNELKKLNPYTTINVSFDFGEIDSVVRTLDSILQLQGEYDSVSNCINTTNTEVTGLQQNLLIAEDELVKLKEELKVCPTCEKPF